MLNFGKRNRRTKPKRTEPSLLQRIDWRSIGMATLAVSGFAVIALSLMAALDRPVRRIVVEGPFLRVAPPEIESAVNAAIEAGLASLDLDQVRQCIEDLPWVDSAVVQRRWPDSIRVVVVEQVAAAQWNDSGLLNARGELFIRNARYVPPELPLLAGPPGSEADVAQLYLDAQGRLIETGLRLTGLRVDERGAWEIELDNGLMVRLGRQAVTERLERFIRLASPMVAKRTEEIRYVDMRYTNGFSIGWNKRSAVAGASIEEVAPDA